MKQSIPSSTSLFSPSTATVAAFLFCSLMAGSGQTVASTPPYVVTDVGPFYRVWQRTVPLTNSTTGQITQQVQRYTELEDGMYYPSNGMWVESQDLIEISSNGAQAVHGPMQAAFDADITSRGAVTLTSPSGEVFKSHPLGLFYSDPGSGKVAQIASIQPSVGRLYPPNVVVFSNALSGLRADLMLVWAKNGYEQNLVIEQAPPLPESFGLSSATAHLQFWSAIDDWPEPLEQRQVQLKPGLTDHILMFNGCWFPVGSAFALGAQPTPTAGQPVRIRVLSPSDPGAVPVAKSIVTIGNQKVLIEELNYTDLASAFTALPRAASPANKGKLLRLAGDVGVPPKSLAPRTNTSRIDVASTGYSPSGVVIDYTTLFGNTNSYTFYGGETYRINNAFTVGPGLATFQQNACIKFAFGSYLLLSGTVAFPPSYPVVFTSKDDNWYGYTMPDSTAEPGYSAAKAIWIYYPTVQTTINNALVRCAGRCVRYDQSRPALAPLISNSAFQRSFIGAEVNIPGDIITLSLDTSCNVPTPVSIVAGSVAGTVTADCGVSPPAMVNDPRTDLTGLDPSKNSQSECSFVLPDSSTVVAAFWNTHLSEYALGIDHSDFPGIVSPRSISWAVSGNSGSTFSDSGPILPISTTIRNGTLVANGAAAVTNGDAGDPVMCYDPGTGGPNGTIYLLANPSREQSYWNGFRLWKSTDKGATFTFVNGNVPGAVVAADKPMIKVSSTTHDIYAAGAQAGNTVWAAHSGNGGLSWDNYKTIETSSPSSGTDIAIDASGTVYFFWLQGAGTGPTVNKPRYARLLSTNWSSPHDFGITLTSANVFGAGHLLRSKMAPLDDYFESNAFPRIAIANGRVYVVYADLPASWASTGDQGDVFIAEATINPDHSLGTPGVRDVFTGNSTDQWNPSIAINPAGTEVFIGYYSRQDDPNNGLIMAYGTKANIANGLGNATFERIPISTTAFPALFAGTTSPAQGGWAYDPVWPQTNVCLDRNAVYTDCPGGTLTTDATYVHFCADDYTWAAADNSYFYFAWCDRSGTFGQAPQQRPDADVKFARIKQ